MYGGCHRRTVNNMVTAIKINMRISIRLLKLLYTLLKNRARIAKGANSPTTPAEKTNLPKLEFKSPSSLKMGTRTPTAVVLMAKAMKITKLPVHLPVEFLQ